MNSQLELNPSAVVIVETQEIERVGVPIKVDANPIARYNHAV